MNKFKTLNSKLVHIGAVKLILTSRHLKLVPESFHLTMVDKEYFFLNFK